MGGFTGGMNHLYDNDAITFKQIKDIFRKASTGELEGTEKTDGQNAVITFDVETQQAKVIRNKGHERVGGINREQLIKFFTVDRKARGVNPAPDSVVQGYDEALASFENVVKQFPTELQNRVFLSSEGYPIFYNSEVMATENPNVINYDSDVLLIHRVGHWKLNPKPDPDDPDAPPKAEELDEGEAVYLSQLESALKQHQEIVKRQKFRVQSNAVKTLKGLDDDIVLNTAIKDLEREQNRLGVSDSQSVAEYLIASLDAVLDSRYGEDALADEQKMPIIHSLMEYRVKNRHLKSTIKNILATVPEVDQARRDIISDIMSNNVSKSLLNEAILPLELVIHFFGTEMLKAFESFAILDNSSEAERLEKELNDSIALLVDPNIDVEGKYPKVYELVQRQIAKFHRDGDKYLHKTAAEGFVFDYDGWTYKFTGTFAPMNQLLGIFEYGRGDVPPMKSLKLNETEYIRQKRIGLIPISGKPYHAGHHYLVTHAADENDVVVLYVSLADRKRAGEFEIFGNDMEEVWRQELEKVMPPNVKVEYGGSPVRNVYETINTAALSNSSNTYVVYSDPTDTKLNYPQENRDKYMQPLYEKGQVIFAAEENPEAFSRGEGSPDVSGTRLRQALQDNDFDEFAGGMPPGVDTENIWNILTGSKKKSIDANDIYGLVDTALEEYENLEEMNASGAGAADGPSGAAFGVPKKAKIVDPYKEMRKKRKKDKDKDEEKIVKEIVDYLMSEVQINELAN